MNLNLKNFDFDFSEKQIALHPLPKGKSRLLVVNPKEIIQDTLTQNLVNFLEKKDILIINNTKVIPARLYGKTLQQQAIELLLLKPMDSNSYQWEAMGKPGKYLREKDTILFNSTAKATVLKILPNGHRLIEFDIVNQSFDKWLESVGVIPLPPYIKRNAQKEDTQNYQSIWAKYKGSVAAPTASLHFSNQHLEAIKQKNITIAEITLHIGAGTFKPIQSSNIIEHQMHSEFYQVTQETINLIHQTKQNGGRVFALGTTVARVLETIAEENNLKPNSGYTNKFIYPGYQWKLVDGLFTNFHFPKSSLFILICSLLGIEKAKEYYQYAINNNYRLFSYGDAMLIC